MMKVTVTHLAGVALGLVALVGLGSSTAPHATAACAAAVEYGNVTYLGLGARTLDRADVGGAVGPAALPACNDVVGPGVVPAQPTPIMVSRVRGVAPRFALALNRPYAPQPQLFVLGSSPCAQKSSFGGTLACLRVATRRFMTGPSLIVSTSAISGSVISLGIHTTGATARKNTVFGLDALLQQRTAAGWRSIYHLPFSLPDTGAEPPPPVAVGTPGYGVRDVGFYGAKSRPVRLPAVPAGQYRIAKQVSRNGRQRWLVAYLTILDAPTPCDPPCTHG
jgi:Family of unknown function (DUF6281)